MLVNRVLTALFLIPLVLVLLLFQGFAFFIAAGVMLYAGWEWRSLVRWPRTVHLIFMFVLAAAMVYPWYTGTIRAGVMDLYFGVAAAWWILALILITWYPDSRKVFRKSRLVRALMGLVSIAPCWLALSLLLRFSHPRYLLLCLLLIWGADTGAYIAGNVWGKRKLVPQVSPGKTVAGLVGGIVTGMMIPILWWLLEWMSFDTYVQHKPFIIAGAAGFDFHWTSWLRLPTFSNTTVLPPLVIMVGVALITVLFSIIGDLTLSMLKRNVDIKDTGSILPGHGGLLDRIDSMLAALPIFYLLALIVRVL